MSTKRRSFWYIISVIAAMAVKHVIDWYPDVIGIEASVAGLAQLGGLAVAGAIIVALVWSNPTRLKVVFALVIGAVAYAFAWPLLVALFGNLIALVTVVTIVIVFALLATLSLYTKPVPDWFKFKRDKETTTPGPDPASATTYRKIPTAPDSSATDSAATTTDSSAAPAADPSA